MLPRSRGWDRMRKTVMNIMQQSYIGLIRLCPIRFRIPIIIIIIILIRVRVKSSSSLVMPDKSWSPALILRLSGIPWRMPRSLRSLVHEPIGITKILLRYRILAALLKSTARRARDSVNRTTGRLLSTGG